MRASSAPHSVSARSGGYSVSTIHIVEVRASPAPHSVSARSGGYSVSTILIKSACIIGASVSNVSSVHYLLCVHTGVSNSSSVSILSVLYLICVPSSVFHHSLRVSQRSSSVSSVVFRAPQEGARDWEKSILIELRSLLWII